MRLEEIMCLAGERTIRFRTDTTPVGFYYSLETGGQVRYKGPSLPAHGYHVSLAADLFHDRWELV